MGKQFPDFLEDKYEIYNYKHAAEIIVNALGDEWSDILACLAAFKISPADLIESGGAETNIPAKVGDVLYPRGWKNVKISADLHINFYERIIDQKQYQDYPYATTISANYVDGHHVDFLKGRLAMCLEWNKKDLSFDRVLNAFKTFYDCNIISAGIILTRSSDLNDVFRELTDTDGKPIIKKYGASSTWMGRLTPKIESRQSGGCPILALGIKKQCIEGYE